MGSYDAHTIQYDPKSEVDGTTPVWGAGRDNEETSESKEKQKEEEESVVANTFQLLSCRIQ